MRPPNFKGAARSVRRERLVETAAFLALIPAISQEDVPVMANIPIFET
jgi:hypothetical protein